MQCGILIGYRIQLQQMCVVKSNIIDTFGAPGMY